MTSSAAGQPKERLVLGRGHARLWLATQCLVLAVALVPFYSAELPSGLDLYSHLAEADRVSEALGSGDLDLWFEGQNLGYPLFRSYPPLLALLAGALIAIFGSVAAPLLLFKILIGALVLALPWALYRGLRWLGAGRRYALIAGALPWCIADGTGFGLSLASVGGLGLAAQLLGLVLAPLALGALGRPGRLRAGLLLALTFLAHPYCALLTVGAALTIPRARGALVEAGTVALLLSACWWIPALVHRAEVGGFPWRGPAEAGLGSDPLWTALFDHQRWPWLGLLVLLGVALAILRPRRFPRGFRGTALLLAASLLLASGAGAVLGADSQPLRAVLGIHLAGLCLAAAALDAALGQIQLPALLLALWVGLAAASSSRLRETLSSVEPDADSPALCAALAEGRGRIWSHERYFSGHPWYRNELPRCAARPGLASRGRGFHDSLQTYYVETFRPSGPLLRLFDVRSIVTVGDAPLEERWFERRVVGDHRIYEAKERFGHSALVRSPYALAGPPRALRTQLGAAIEPAFAAGLLPRLSGGPSATDAARADEALRRALEERAPITSSITAEVRRGPGHYQLELHVRAEDGPLFALLKEGSFSGWEATLDGRPAPVVTLAPGLPAVSVGAGQRRLELIFRRATWEKALYLGDLAAMALAATWILRRRRPSRTSLPYTAPPNAAPPG